MIKNKQSLSWPLIPITLQIIYMYYLLRTEQLFIVGLSLAVYFSFVVLYFYRYGGDFEKILTLSRKKEDRFEFQNQSLKFFVYSIIYFSIASVLLSVLFKIDFLLSLSITPYSGILGIFTSSGIYHYKKLISGK